LSKVAIAFGLILPHLWASFSLSFEGNQGALRSHLEQAHGGEFLYNSAQKLAR